MISQDPDRELVATYLQNKWSSLGIRVYLKKTIKRVLIGDILKHGTYDVAVFGWSQPKLQINKDFYLATKIPSEKNNWLGNNFSRWRNSVADEALKRADNEFEEKKVKGYLAVFQKEFRQDIPWLPLYFQKRFVVVPAEIRNYRVFPDWEPETYDVENW
ncbi:MAG: hypothetical protein C5B49_05670 [Bdellovibrio sp.]|nr:MAG: hypothetical protein C5B49_05670 [Bdellovibrio sp.]